MTSGGKDGAEPIRLMCVCMFVCGRGVLIDRYKTDTKVDITAITRAYFITEPYNTLMWYIRLSGNSIWKDIL
jgi:hypothetical protein